MGAVTGKLTRKALPHILAFFIVLMIFSSYSNTFISPPFLDDFHSFIYEKSLYLNSVSVSNILALSQSKFGLTRFLPIVTLALNHSLGHSELTYFHAVNLAIHLLAFFAVFWLSRQILAAGKNRDTEGPIYEIAGFFPLCAAAIWALEPRSDKRGNISRSAHGFHAGALFYPEHGVLHKSAPSFREKDAERRCFLLSLRACRLVQLPFKGKLGGPAGRAGPDRYLVFRFRLAEEGLVRLPENRLENTHSSCCGAVFILLLWIHRSIA